MMVSGREEGALPKRVLLTYTKTGGSERCKLKRKRSNNKSRSTLRLEVARRGRTRFEKGFNYVKKEKKA